MGNFRKFRGFISKLLLPRMSLKSFTNNLEFKSDRINLISNSLDISTISFLEIVQYFLMLLSMLLFVTTNLCHGIRIRTVWSHLISSNERHAFISPILLINNLSELCNSGKVGLRIKEGTLSVFHSTYLFAIL